MEYTPEQIAEMHDRNENFHGKYADFGKVQLYNKIKDGLVDLLDNCRDAFRVSMDELKPNNREQNALLTLDLSKISILDPEQANKLADIIQLADRLIISADQTGIRFSFGVEKIWSE